MKSPKSSKPVRLSALSRRDFIKTTTLAAGAMMFGVPTLLRAANLNSKLNIAAIGVMGKGQSDLNCCDTENIVALCDVDSARSAEQRSKYASAAFYTDYRKMLDTMGKGIDAVMVSTPDHFHAIAASAAMQLGKHVYCQKPLVQTIYEARYLRQLAHDTGLVTQMGNQGSAADGLRRAVECIHAGIIGQASQVHIWTNRPVWPQGMTQPGTAEPVPASLDWNQWIGPAQMRPYNKEYQPFKWRGWQDFGTGALGDMACHTVNMPFRALKLGYPTEIEAQPLGGMNPETYPIGSKIRFEFPARTASPALSFDPLTLWWYDGGNPLPDNPYGHDGSNKPPTELTGDIVEMLGEVPGSGCLIIGDKGKIFSPDDYGEQFFVKLNDEAKFVHYKKHPAIDPIPEIIPRNPFKGDSDRRHHQEWIAAIKENDPEMAYSRFAIGAQLTEIMLLGCVSLRAGQKIEWDGPKMTATNCSKAAHFIKRKNRHGWALS